MKFGICNETYQGWEFDAACAHAASAGYDGIEIAPFTLADDPRELSLEAATRYGRVAMQAGLEVIGLHWLLVKPMGLHLTTDDTAVRKQTIGFASRLAEICAAMSGKIMVWGSPKQRNIAAGQKREDARGHAVDAIWDICEVAGPLGVTIAMEPLGPAETNFLNTAAETIEFIRAVDHPACQLHLDVKAMSTERLTIPEIITASRPWLRHFHANDPNLRGPGFGNVQFEPIAEALYSAGYEGFVSVEVFDYTPDPETIATNSIAYLKRTFAR